MRRFSAVYADLALESAGIILLSFLASGCGSTLELPSRWADTRIQIDGNLRDWVDSTTFVEKDGIRCGVMNDTENVYVCMMSSTPNVGRQLIMRGMTIWFDPNGGEKKIIGVRFPVGAMRPGMMRPEMRDRRPTEARARAPEERRQRFDEIEREALQEFEFLGPGADDRQRVLRIQGQGVEFHITATPERFVYEMKIPLEYSSRHPYAVESYAGSMIGVGFDSSLQERAIGGASNGESPEGVPPGGVRAGGRGGRGGGMPGGMRPGGMLQGGTDATFSFWTHVRLAERAK
ncbi:MAG: hypothetical protein A2X66_09790 [Ignavibacteria bacterium GWA2_54_16]|nr:MAG: hypothetical protein A2X66_09790 [Ignavibacteria bacterium GWA2_54_16]